jgi:hypothetical protein
MNPDAARQIIDDHQHELRADWAAAAEPGPRPSSMARLASLIDLTAGGRRHLSLSQHLLMVATLARGRLRRPGATDRG